jgi:uncharacterized membrane protein
MLLAGGMALAALLAWRFAATLEPAQRFMAPGGTQVEVRSAGEYVLWHDHRTLFGGRSYDLSAALPDGARISVEAAQGAVAVRPYSGMSSEDSEGRSASVARFQADVPGRYRVSVEGDFSPRPMSVGPNRLWPVLKLIGAVVAILAVSLGGAAAAALLGFLGHAPASPGPSTPGREKAVRQIAVAVYGLQAAALLVGVTFFVAVLLAYLRRGEAAGTWLESHFTWQIRTFWWSLAWSVLGVATLVVIVGFFILPACAVWYVYRVVRGWSELNEGRAVYREG